MRGLPLPQWRAEKPDGRGPPLTPAVSVPCDRLGPGVPVDTAAEAEGFLRWVREATGRDVDLTEVRRLMASPEGAPPADEHVEETVEKLAALAGLPLPEWPTDEDAPAG